MMDFSGENILVNFFDCRNIWKLLELILKRNHKDSMAISWIYCKMEFGWISNRLILIFKTFLKFIYPLLNVKKYFKINKKHPLINMREDRWTNLIIFSFEQKHAKKINFDEIIDKFAEVWWTCILMLLLLPEQINM